MDNFILYGIKGIDKFYISNINPITWSSSINEAKRYLSRHNAERDILNDYNNYHFIKANLNNNYLDSLYVAMVDICNNILEEYKLI